MCPLILTRYHRERHHVTRSALVASVGGGTTLVANIFVAHFWHGDKVHRTDVVGVIFVVIGAALFAYSSTDSQEDSVKAKDLPHHFTQPWFLTYLSVQGLVMLILLGGIGGSYVNQWRIDWTFRFMSPVMDEIHQCRRRIEKLEKHVKKLGGKIDPSGFGSMDDVEANSLRSSMHKFEANPHGDRHWSDKYIYAACAGTVGGLSVLLGGLTIKTFTGGWDLVKTVWAYVFLVGLILTLVIQVHFQNQAMKLGDNMVIFPVFQAFWISFGVISALYFYNTDKDWGVRWWRASGILPMIIGIACLMQHPAKEKIWRRQSQMMLSREVLEANGIRTFVSVSTAEDDESPEEEDEERGCSPIQPVLTVSVNDMSSSLLGESKSESSIRI